MKLSDYLYPDKQGILNNLHKTSQETMEFFIPVDYYGIEQGEDVETPDGEYVEPEFDFGEMHFEVPLQFVIDNNNTYKPIWKNNRLVKWDKKKVNDWRDNDWLWEDAEDIFYRAVKEKKICSLNFE